MLNLPWFLKSRRNRKKITLGTRNTWRAKHEFLIGPVIIYYYCAGSLTNGRKLRDWRQHSQTTSHFSFFVPKNVYCCCCRRFGFVATFLPVGRAACCTPLIISCTSVSWCGKRPVAFWLLWSRRNDYLHAQRSGMRAVNTKRENIYRWTERDELFEIIDLPTQLIP